VDIGIYSENQEIHSDTSFNLSIKPVFEPLTDILEGIYINEIAAVSSGFKDELQENSGYIELYNSNNEEVYLVNCFLSDDLNWLDRYAIPDSTPMPANSFLTFYVDGESLEGPLHTPFKANKQGETMVFSQKAGDTYFIHDSVSYERIVEEYSYGRYEDGTGDWLHMNVITPGYPNDSTQLEIISNQQEMFTQKISVYPNPVSEYLNISLDNMDYTRDVYYLEILDISGRIVIPRIWLNNCNSTINTNNLKSGLYIIRVSKDNQLISTSKVVKVR
jgi:hypothetical protein